MACHFLSNTSIPPNIRFPTGGTAIPQVSRMLPRKLLPTIRTSQHPQRHMHVSRRPLVPFPHLSLFRLVPPSLYSVHRHTSFLASKPLGALTTQTPIALLPHKPVYLFLGIHILHIPRRLGWSRIADQAALFGPTP